MSVPVSLDPTQRAVPLLFTGQGASLAIAKAAASTLLQLGRPAMAALPDAPRPPMAHVHVSRSASLPPGCAPGLLVAEAGSPPARGVSCLSVPSSGDPDAWVPVTWVRSAALLLREQLGFAPWQPHAPVLVPMSREGVVLVSDHASDALQTFLTSVQVKVPELRLEAAACSELGHGLHARLAARGGTLVRLGGSLPAPEARWLRVHAPAVRVVGLQGPRDPLAVLASAARFVETLAEATGIDLSSPRLPPEADQLRHMAAASAVAEVA